jgi:hypothetical protein
MQDPGPQPDSLVAADPLASMATSKASFISRNWEEKHFIRISVAFRLYLVKIIQILTN